MSEERRRGISVPDRLRRVLAIVLALAFLLQPALLAGAPCSRWSRMLGASCCCQAAKAEPRGCCSQRSQEPARRPTVTADRPDCNCALREAPVEFPMRLESTSRASDGDAGSAFAEWLRDGATVSASVVALEISGPAAAEPDSTARGPCGFGPACAPSLAHGMRAHLATLCVARC